MPDWAKRDDLTRYVNDYLARKKRSIRDLHKAMQRASGPSPSNAWLQDIVNGTMNRAPDEYRLEVLAEAMGEPYEKLAALAAKQFLGVDRVVVVRVGDDGEVAVPEPKGIDEQGREEFRAAVAELAKRWPVRNGRDTQ